MSVTSLILQRCRELTNFRLKVIGKLFTSWLAYELAGDDGPLYGRGEQIYGLAGGLYGIIYEWSHLVGSFHYSLFDSASFCVEWGSYLYVRIQSHHT